MSDIFSLDPSKVTNDLSFGSITQWDSLGHINLISALEEEFEIRFSDEEALEILNFALVEYTVKRHLGVV